jgi:hypothetical protein
LPCPLVSPTFNRHLRVSKDIHMLQNDTAVFHAFAWNPVKAEYDDWRGMGTRMAITVRGFEAQGPVHYCPKEWLNDGWLDKPKGR